MRKRNCSLNLETNLMILNNFMPGDSLLKELKATKEVLISSLNTVHHLELESDKVPELEAKISELENM